MPETSTSASLPDDLLPLPEYARSRALTPDQIREWVRRGRIRTWKFGEYRQSRVFVSVSEVDRFVADRMRPAS